MRESHRNEVTALLDRIERGLPNFQAAHQKMELRRQGDHAFEVDVLPRLREVADVIDPPAAPVETETQPGV